MLNYRSFFFFFVLNFLFDDKRFVVCRFSDSIVQSDKEYCRFTVIYGPYDKPMFEVQYKGETKRFSPE